MLSVVVLCILISDTLSEYSPGKRVGIENAGAVGLFTCVSSSIFPALLCSDQVLSLRFSPLMEMVFWLSFNDFKSTVGGGFGFLYIIARNVSAIKISIWASILVRRIFFIVLFLCLLACFSLVLMVNFRFWLVCAYYGVSDTIYSMFKVIVGLFTVLLLLTGCSESTGKGERDLDSRGGNGLSFEFADEYDRYVVDSVEDLSISSYVGQSVVFQFMKVGVENSVSSIGSDNGLTFFYGLRSGDVVSYPGVVSSKVGSFKIKVDDGVFSAVFDVVFKERSTDKGGAGFEIGEMGGGVAGGFDEGNAVDLPTADLSDFDSQAKKVSRFANELIGLDANKAKLMLDGADIKWRVGVLDGDVFALTMDYNPSRVTLSIVDSKVVEALVG